MGHSLHGAFPTWGIPYMGHSLHGAFPTRGIPYTGHSVREESRSSGTLPEWRFVSERFCSREISSSGDFFLGRFRS
jgi:hypothetical protein